MQLKQIISILEEMAPTAYAEAYDNVGLIVGHDAEKVTGVLVCHDALETVVDEAIEKSCNLIVCFHPIIFSGLKKITGKTYVERAVMKALRNNIAIYAIHTGLDNHPMGVNKILCDVLHIKNPNILHPKSQFLQKLSCFVPVDNFREVQRALFDAGAGNISDYSECSFRTIGIGSFKGGNDSNPTIGNKNEYEEVEECKLEVIFEKHKKHQIIEAMKQHHPYEEVAYDLFQLENDYQEIGLGMIGTLENPQSPLDYLNFVKKQLDLKVIRHSQIIDKPIQRVAVLGGSGSSEIAAAKSQKADLYITADLKYHDFFQAENQIILADVGHFESEKYVKNYIFDYLSKKIPNFAIILSELNTNPINYL